MGTSLESFQDWSRGCNSSVQKGSRSTAVPKRLGQNVPWQPIAQAYFVSERIEDWHDPMQTQFTIFALCLVTALYGGLHAAAWNAKFPTPTECLLLRISALVIVSTGLGYVTGQLLYQHLDEPRRSLKARAPLWHQRRIGKIECLALLFLLGTIGVLYVAARVYIPVESFISFRWLSIDCYKTPMWSQFLLHIETESSARLTLISCQPYLY